MRDQIEDAANGQGRSVSEWARQLMLTELGLANAPDNTDWSTPTTLSKRERRQLVLTHRIAELVTDDPSEAEYHEMMADVLRRGFTAEYADEFVEIEEEMPISECRLVWDILDMFSVIELSIEHIGSDGIAALDDLAEHVLIFRGFDFNDRREGRLATYAKHLLRTRRWTDLAHYFDNEHEGGNSHAPVLDSYQRMLEVYRPFWAEMTKGVGRNRFQLNEDELRALVMAAYHPSQRPDEG